MEGEGLGIFTPDSVSTEAQLPVWEDLERRRYRKLLDHGPEDGFDQLKRWTEEGKLWPYPMDNEWRCEEEDVGFQDHVLLQERLTQMGFPQDGPIRKFMDIVAIGLSRNPYMSAEKKHRHLEWFKEYLGEKEAFIMKLHDGSGKRSPDQAAAQ